MMQTMYNLVCVYDTGFTWMRMTKWRYIYYTTAQEAWARNGVLAAKYKY